MFGLRWCSGGGGQALLATTPSSSLPRISSSGSGRRWRRCAVETLEGRNRNSSRSTDLVDLEYADLNLRDNYGAANLGHLRIRQHVNPLSASFTEPVPVPDWKAVFRDPTLPLMVDIGSGSGRFLIWLAKNLPDSRNYLGLEIRHKLVHRSQFWVKDLNLQNIYFMYANANVSFDQLVSAYPGPLTLVSILCPDPHFKKRHQKRRVVQNPLVDSISENLSTEGQAGCLGGVGRRVWSSTHFTCYYQRESDSGAGSNGTQKLQAGSGRSSQRLCGGQFGCSEITVYSKIRRLNSKTSYKLSL